MKKELKEFSHKIENLQLNNKKIHKKMKEKEKEIHDVNKDLIKAREVHEKDAKYKFTDPLSGWK